MYVIIINTTRKLNQRRIIARVKHVIDSMIQFHVIAKRNKLAVTAAWCTHDYIAGYIHLTSSKSML